jgi:outer membrane protein TolC
LPADLLARRPDLAAARQALIASDWRVAQSKAALLPRLSLTASGGTSTEELSELLDPDFKVWNLAANLAQPIFQGGRLRAGVDLSNAETRQALARYQSAVLRAFAEVESALAAEENMIRREERLREAAEQSSAALQLAQDRYQAGLDSFITVLEAQRRSLEADTQFVTVRRVRLENRVDLHLALGGSFSPGEDPRATPHASNAAAKNNAP